eukprot:1195238-Prymnesium_polylepis.1
MDDDAGVFDIYSAPEEWLAHETEERFLCSILAALRPRSRRADFWAVILAPLYETTRIVFRYKQLILYLLTLVPCAACVSGVGLAECVSDFWAHSVRRLG